MSSQIIQQIANDEIINQIKTFAGSTRVLLVGGVIRDFCLGKQNFDKDIIVIDKEAKIFAQELAKTLNATYIPLDEENKNYRLVLKD